MSAAIIERLSAQVEARRTARPEESYVASLYARGIDVILKKLGEEATEVIIAAKNGTPREVVHEIADLWFHCLVTLAALDIPAQRVFVELENRFGRSGLDERPARQADERAD